MNYLLVSASLNAVSFLFRLDRLKVLPRLTVEYLLPLSIVFFSVLNVRKCLLCLSIALKPGKRKSENYSWKQV